MKNLQVIDGNEYNKSLICSMEEAGHPRQEILMKYNKKFPKYVAFNTDCLLQFVKHKF